MKLFRAALLALLLAQLLFSQNPVPTTPAMPTGTAILPLAEVRAGMKGVSYTVFTGTQPEAMDVEVLGVLRNSNGPKGDLILVRLSGTKPEFTGVVAGMSGSPVYVDGKLMGALSYRIGAFSKEPIAGVTPIEEMLEIKEIDHSAPAGTIPMSPVAKPATAKTSSGAVADPEFNSLARVMTPIEAPLVFSGFSEDAVRRFAPQFANAGVTPVLGAGSASSEAQPEPLVPGSAVSALLVRGDMTIAATCTVTWVDADRLLACGHPLTQFGAISLPMNKARVVVTLPSPLNAFKIVNTTEPVGAFVQDRHTGILGRFGEDPDMIPVSLKVHSGTRQKEFHYEIANNPKLTSVAMMTTLYSALQGVNEYGDETSYRVNGAIGVAGYPSVSLKNMYAPFDGAAPTAYLVAVALGERFNQVFVNPISHPGITGIDLDVELLSDRRWARIESARTAVTEARPGDEITVETVLRPYRGERIVRQVPVRIPPSTPRGPLRILVSDGDSLDRLRRSATASNYRTDLAASIALLNKEHSNDRLYVSLLEPNPQAIVDDKVMPGLPPSVMNVMDSLRGTRDMTVAGESAVDESSTPVDLIVLGSQVITVDVK
jgi:SpoIVB peptidase S55